ncbi:MAG: T9SS type A sorting domain-containing protein [Chitinophagaceae bacterium]|nr:T9SS type A sorting domain-containing protein [Chitinophagaceae bacterium]
MKNTISFIAVLLFYYTATAQSSITAVNITNTTTTVTSSYTNSTNTYNWGINPNNNTAVLNGFTSGGIAYTYASFLTGIVKIRRANNAIITGNYTLIWAEANIGVNTFSMYPQYQGDMEPFFNNNIYNKGTDNFFDNTASNCNNIERLDWIIAAGYSTPYPAKVGFAVFERGAAGAHDPFGIAAITALDALGKPSAYSKIVRVATASYGETGPNVTYEIVKANVPGNLLDAGSNTQSRGGVLISFQDLGVTANTTIYGYSLLPSDLPVAATPANLVDYTNTTNFPTNSAPAGGGIDLIAITGISIQTIVLPVQFVSIGATENNNTVKVNWKVENETSVDRYQLERSTDGVIFSKVGDVKSTPNPTNTNSYSYLDNIATVSSTQLYYRIKQYDRDGSYYLSKSVAIKRNNKLSSILIYPNPVKESLFVNFYNTINDKGTVSVINSGGSKVISQDVLLSAGNNSFTVNGIDKLAKGVYQLSIKTEDGNNITKQFLKR